MDAELLVLLPAHAEIPTTARHQRVASWGGEEYPQGSEELAWGQHVVLTVDEFPAWVLDLLPSDYLPDGQAYLFNEGCLRQLECQVNDCDFDWDGHSLQDFLKLLLDKQEAWAIAFILHSDQIDLVTAVSPEEAVSKLSDNLGWSSKRQGLLLYRVKPTSKA